MGPAPTSCQPHSSPLAAAASSRAGPPPRRRHPVNADLTTSLSRPYQRRYSTNIDLAFSTTAMTTRLRKNRKKRGHVSTIHGRIGKHPKHPDGRENTDGMHHHRILFNMYHPDYFGKVGMHYFHRLLNKFHFLTLNVDRIWSFVLESAKNSAGSRSVQMVDVTQFIYFKVLGKGMHPEGRPVVVKAKLVWKTAEKKIKEVGGAVILTS